MLIRSEKESHLYLCNFYNSPFSFNLFFFSQQHVACERCQLFIECTNGADIDQIKNLRKLNFFYR